MTRYSQHEEQAAILEAFDQKKPPNLNRFLDIGAYIPKDLSNTRALYELGWSGVMIEPSPAPMCALLREYGDDPRITLIQAAVGVPDMPRLLKLHASEDCVSTIVDKEYENFKLQRNSVFNGSVLVPRITLEEIGDQFQGFDFVSIDAEGISAALFLHALEIGWNPHCFCVENDGEALSQMLSMALRSGYSATYANGLNTVFVRRG